MAYAPHTNTDLIYGSDLPLLLGQFRSEYGKHFEYAERPKGNDWAPELPHIVYVGIDGDYRYAKVLKTVVHVAVDEAADGSAVMDKWPIKQHHKYPAPCLTKHK